jgi:FG-GAP-like repeat/Calx-beta domain
MATSLQPGDIAFSAFQSDDSGGGFNGDAFEFVLLVPVQIGTTIYFTDNEYRTDTFLYTTTENVIRWVAPSDLPAGSVVTFTAPGGIGATSTAQWTGINPGTGTSLATATFTLSDNGDNITALTFPNFLGENNLNGFAIAALNFGSATFPPSQTGIFRTSTTGLPSGLVDGATAVSVGSTQNGRYNDAAIGSVESRTRNAVLSSLNNDTYWTVSPNPLVQPFSTTATFSITTVSIAATDNTATEAPGDTGTFRITRTGDTTAALNVGLGIGGTATNGTDYTGVPSSVTIAAGATTADITVTPVPDSLSESNETVNVVLAGGGSSYDLASPSSATVTISNSTFVPLPTVSISALDPNASESGSNPGVFRITRTGGGGATMPLNVNYTVSGSATSADYTPSIGTSATISATQTYVDVTINPIDDTLVEGPETVNLTLGAGSYTLASPSANFATVSIADNDVRPNDFNGDGKSDILWRNNNGTIATWKMDGTVSPNSLHFGVAPADWKIAGTGDFNGDGKSDILWRHDGGTVAVWKDGITVNPTTLNIGAAPIDWKIAGTGDFNGDGKSDILWRHDGGTVAVWKDGLTINPTTLNIGAAPVDWKIAGTGDFDGDGKSDILWRHDGGTVAIWQMNGITASPSVHIGANSMDWKITGTADFNGDGKSDILWRNDDGTVAIWQMNGITASPSVHIGANTNDWKIAGTIDYNGDNKSDILWRHDSGTTAVWEMNGIAANPISTHIGIPPGAAPDWQIVGSPQTYAPPVFV